MFSSKTINLYVLLYLNKYFHRGGLLWWQLSMYLMTRLAPADVQQRWSLLRLLASQRSAWGKVTFHHFITKLDPKMWILYCIAQAIFENLGPNICGNSPKSLRHFQNALNLDIPYHAILWQNLSMLPFLFLLALLSGPTCHETFWENGIKRNLLAEKVHKTYSQSWRKLSNCRKGSGQLIISHLHVI